MTMPTLEGGLHLTDEALLMACDGEARPLERGPIATHLEHCLACRDRYESFELDSRRFVAMVETLDVAPPVDAKRRVLAAARMAQAAASRRDRWSRTLLQAAAGAVLFVGIASATPSVRTWIVERARSLAPNREFVPVQESAPVAAATSVSFTPTTDVVVVDVAAIQAAGTVTLVITGGTRVRATRHGGDAADAITVIPAGLRIQNRSDSEASYEIAVPGRTTGVVVRIAGGASTRWTARQIRNGAVVIPIGR